MVKKTVTYTDFGGNEVTKDFYFNLTKMEFNELDESIPGGLQNLIDKLLTERDSGLTVKLLSILLLAAYGEKSEDGRFVKEDIHGRKLSSYFKVSEAWDVLFMNLVKNEKEMSEFLVGIVPKDMAAEAKAAMDNPEEALKRNLTLLDGQKKSQSDNEV